MADEPETEEERRRRIIIITTTTEAIGKFFRWVRSLFQ